MTLTIRRLDPDTPEAEIAARWRYDAFFADGSDTFEKSRAALLDFLRRQDGYEMALLAESDGKPAGLCLFVRDEADPNPRPDLTPWLAALYVAPDFRRRGIGRAPVKAIEDHARAVGTRTLYLYTSEAEGVLWRARLDGTRPLQPEWRSLRADGAEIVFALAQDGFLSIIDRVSRSAGANMMAGKTPKKSAKVGKKAAAKQDPAKASKPRKVAKITLLSGGNPQIAKAYGDAPVQAYIAAMPGWKREIGRRLDALITRCVPGVQKAVKWNSPFYGVEDRGWFLSFHCFTKYIKVAFFRGTSLRPVPPGASKHKEVRYLDIREHDEFDEAQLVAWTKQASQLPGEKM